MRGCFVFKPQLQTLHYQKVQTSYHALIQVLFQRNIQPLKVKSHMFAIKKIPVSGQNAPVNNRPYMIQSIFERWSSENMLLFDFILINLYVCEIGAIMTGAILTWIQKSHTCMFAVVSYYRRIYINQALSMKTVTLHIYYTCRVYIILLAQFASMLDLTTWQTHTYTRNVISV